MVLSLRTNKYGMCGGDTEYQSLNIFKCYAIRSLNMSLKIEMQHKKQIRKVVYEMYRNTRREAKINDDSQRS